MISDMELHLEQNNNVDEGSKFDGQEEITCPSSSLTLRMIMQGKEAGSIIGKKGDNVKKFREESGARINISDASCPERIVTVAGTTQQIVDAFSMICRRFEEDMQSANPTRSTAKQLITLRLIVPASQCGSLIGKAGAKIKEIREVAGASIQISSDMLPNSTERLITVSGSVDAVTRGIYHICHVLLESPAKGVTIPYRPKLASMASPVLVAANGQTYALPPGQFLIPQSSSAPRDAAGFYPGIPAQGHVIQYQPVHPQFAKVALQQGMMGYAMSPTAFLAPSYPVPGGFIRAAGPPSMMPSGAQQQVHEMKIPNDLIGCIIGRGGSKINEIRQLSGANIKIAGLEETSPDRTVTISGSADSINFAQHLINASIELHRSLLSAQALVNLNPVDTTGSPLVTTTSCHSPVATLNMTSSSNDSPIQNLTPTATGLLMMSFSPLPTMVQHMGLCGYPVQSGMLSHSGVEPGAAITALQPSTTGQQFLPMFPFDSSSTKFVDARSSLALKIKGGFTLASFAKHSNKFSPY